MSYLRIEGLTKSFGRRRQTPAVQDLDLHVEEGEFLVLLGPSGCGKTTTLRCLAGLEAPDSGRIAFGSDTVFDSAAGLNRPPHKRNIGMVFQSYALWPHMSVRKNIEYPLRARRLRHDTAENWVDETAALVQCSDLLDRYPAQLSGGQQQRVALARGLVARPGLVLFDEPLSNLDARLRDSVRSELHELHERVGFTAVFVTHDQSEALALGDRLAIMRSGRLEQFDTPQNVFEAPATEYVAEFVGMSNRLEVEFRDGEWRVADQTLRLPQHSPLNGHEARRRLIIRLRPEDISVNPDCQAVVGQSMGLSGIVIDTGYGGRHLDMVVALESVRLQACIPLDDRAGWTQRIQTGDHVHISFNLARSCLFDESGRLEPTRTDVVPDRN